MAKYFADAPGGRMRKRKLPKDMNPSPRPWAWGLVPRGYHAVVKAARRAFENGGEA